MRLVKNYKNYWMLLRSILGAAFYRNKLRCLILYILYCLKKVDTMCKKYMLALASKEMDNSFVRKVSFEDSFGFSFKKRNGYEIWKKLLERNGFDGNLYKTNYDEETYQLTKQHLFWFGNHFS